MTFLLSISNIACIYPIDISLIKKDYTTLFCILSVAFFSVTSHLLENFRYEQFITNYTENILHGYYNILNKCDIWAALILSFRIIYLIHIYNVDYLNIFIYMYPLIFLLASTFIRESHFTTFEILHSFWHFNIFLNIGLLLNHIYDNDGEIN